MQANLYYCDQKFLNLENQNIRSFADELNIPIEFYLKSCFGQLLDLSADHRWTI
jgi:hypothetical protein